MKKMKKILALLLCLVLAVGAVTGTLAYLTDRDSEVNVFTVGDVKIDLTEDFEQGAKLTPGVEIQKKPVITNTGKNDAWVWLTFALPSALDNYVQGTEQGSNENVIHWNPKGATTEGYVTQERVEKAINDGFFKDYDTTNLTADYINTNKMHWNVFNSIGEGKNAYPEVINGVKYNVYVLLYNKALEPGETTLPNIEKVFLDAQVDIDPEGNWYKVVGGETKDLKWNTNENGAPLIYVNAYAIQTDGFPTVQDAYTAYGAQWGDKGAEYSTAGSIFEYEGVTYVQIDDTYHVTSNGGDTIYRGILSDGKTTATDVVINEGITRLNNRALCKAPTITNVELPESLTYVDESVFQQSSITSIVIPESVTYIGKNAFGACDSLETITINAKDVTIANYVARACANLKEVYIYSDSVTFESGSMYFTNKENGDASGITFYVKSQDIANTLYNAFSTSHSYGLLIKSIDGATTYYNTLK